MSAVAPLQVLQCWSQFYQFYCLPTRRLEETEDSHRVAALHLPAGGPVTARLERRQIGPARPARL